jgi:hypothetical protein
MRKRSKQLSIEICRIYSLAFSFCFFIIISGCTSNNSIIALPTHLVVPDNLLNKDLRVIAPANWNDLKKEEDFISLEVTLATNKQIVTRPDFNAKIFLYDDVAKEWEEIENHANYETPPDEITLQQGDTQGLTVLPDLSRASVSQNKVLILVSGNVIENGVRTDEIVGTYIILNLESE